jgi:signal peptidase
MFIADWKGHTIFVRQPGASSAQTYFQSAKFHQPNDLAISRDGTLFASDPDFHTHTGGRIWRIVTGPDGTVSGTIMPAERQMHLTNGLDLSPDEKTLYVSESDTREVWAYTLQGERLLSPRLLHRFETGQLDGLRTDVRGRIFLARPGAGVVSVLEPDGALSREVRVQGLNPTNVTFGGPDGRTVYVTNASTRGIERFLTDAPGREICWRDSLPCDNKGK